MVEAPEEPLSSIDTVWYRMEADVDSVDIGGLLIFDEPLDLAALRRVVEARLLRKRRFRQRVVERPSGLGRPHWEDDPNFILDAHLHHVALPDPGDHAALEALVGDLMSVRFDLERPPWHLHLIDNYQGGSALMARFHHCIGDGFALAHLLLAMADARAPSEGPTAAAASKADDGHGSAGHGLLHELQETLRHPDRALDAARQTARLASTLGHLTLLPPDRPTLLKRPLSGARRAAWSRRIPLDDVKAVGRHLGATINDVLMTAMTGALRTYLARHDEPIDGFDLRAIVPVNMRPARFIEEMDDSLGNRFSLIFLDLPTHIRHPGERLGELKHRMDLLKKSPDALVAFGLLNALGHTPEVIEHLVEDLFARKASLIVSNVPGPRQPLTLAGTPLKDVLFWVPHPAHFGLGLSVLSYAGNVRIGVRSDTAVVPDPRTLADLFEAEFDALAHAG